MPPQRVRRRPFLRQAVAAASTAFAAPAILQAAVRRQEFHVACVGVKGMGFSDLSQVGNHPSVKFVGFCDIDTARFDSADKAFPGVPHFADYRKLFTELGDKFDAAIVSTPDHMHAPVAMAAMKLGKHIYCQKPLTHTVWESRQMRLMADKTGVTTQMGNQIHSNAEYRTGVNLIRSGAIGKVKEVHSWVRVQGREYNRRTDRPPVAPQPEGVSWDLWIGAAAMRPFATEVYHPFKWRDWQDFGSGALGDFGCHILDPVFGATGITSPVRVKAEHDGTTSEVWPGPETVTFEFPGTEFTTGPTFKVIWRDGGLKPPRELAQLPDGVELPGAGSIFIGEGGVMLLPHVGKPSLYPQPQFKDFAIEEVPGESHWHAWVNAAMAGKKTSDGFHYAGPLSETVQLGNIAARHPGVELQWNAADLKIANSEAAQKLVTKTYRDGFGVEAVS